MELFKLFGTIALNGTDKFNSGIDKASSKASELASKIGDGLKTAAKIGTAAIGVAATGIAALTKASVENYAEYEQLVGGTELMFGEAYDFVMEKSKNAYRTVQMSQNDYLQQVNGFATGLKTSLGGNEQAAAELADKIITAEADIVAATGNSQEAVQNAFNGIMKSNFTMLDNLQIGIKPTKEGFQEVIDKVNDWNAASGEATNYMIDNLADCQSALVDYIEMQGLSGYAAEEASKTISGSVASVKAAWRNLLVGLADDEADVEELIDNLVESVDVAAENLLERVEVVLEGAGKMVDKLLPKIINKIPQGISTYLPKIVRSAASIVQSLVSGINENQEAITSAAFDVCMTLIGAISTMLPQILGMGVELLLALVEGIAENLDKLIGSAEEMIIKIVQTLTDPGNLERFFDAALTIIETIGTYLIENLPELVDAAIQLIDDFVSFITDEENLGTLLDTALEIILTIGQGLVEFLPELVGAAIELVSKFAEYVLEPENLNKIIDTALDVLIALSDGLIDNMYVLEEAATELANTLIDSLLEIDWWTVAQKIHSLLNNALRLSGLPYNPVPLDVNTEEEYEEFMAQQEADLDARMDKTRRNLGLLTTEDVEAAGLSGGQAFATNWVLLNRKFYEPKGILGQKISGYATGLDYVPYDNYPAYLHKGEMVVPARQADYLRTGAIAKSNDEVVAMLAKILEAVQAADMSGLSLKVDNREFARMVRAVN